jgi:phosphohistidine phosphatase
MLRLHLLRHAEPLVMGSISSDKDRPLTEHGLKQCETLKNNLNLDWSDITIWCSSAIRTRETAFYFLDPKTLTDVVFKEELYLTSMRNLIELISTYEGTNKLMIIGHNNGLTDLLNYLCDTHTILQTSHYVCLEFHLDHWNEVSRSTATVVRELVP